MRKDGLLICIDPVPIRAAMTNFPGHLQNLRSQEFSGLLEVKGTYDSTHNFIFEANMSIKPIILNLISIISINL